MKAGLSIAERVANWFRPRNARPASQYPSQPFDYLPIWKRGATPGERLREVAIMADKHPERFDKMVIVHTEENEKGIYTRLAFGETTSTIDSMGLLTLAQHRLWHDTHQD